MLSSISNLISGQTGVNSAQLVNDLVAAGREARDAQINQRISLNQARISAIGSAKSSLNTFATALSDLLDGKAFAGELSSTRADLATASYISGKHLVGLPARVEVEQLASAQVMNSDTFSGPDADMGTGTITLNTSKGSFDIDISSPDNTLEDVVKAINEADTGVKATLYYGRNGVKVGLHGEVGSGQSFTVSATGSDNIKEFDKLTKISDAGHAIVKINGVESWYDTNNMDNAIEGLRLDLHGAENGTEFTISGEPPNETVSNLVREFVDAYNELRKGLNNASKPGIDGADAGPLAGERAIRDMVSKLGHMSSTVLRSEGPFRTLADIGVRTNNDGTLTLDETTLNNAISTNVEAVSLMLEPISPDAANPGLAGTLDAIKESLEGNDGSLTLAEQRYQDVAEKLQEMQEKANEQSDRYRELLSRNFADMDRRLSILRSTQSYLEQQIEIWNNSNNN